MKARYLLLFLLLLFIGVAAAYASHGKCGPNMSWEMDRNGRLIITGHGEMNDYSSGNTPWRAEIVTTIEISEGIRSIGRNAFAKSKITSVVLPAGLEMIGNNAFKGCKTLASVILPYGLTTIGKSAFQDCYALPKINFPASVISIGEQAFADCFNLTDLSISSRVKTIGKDAFKNCNHIKTISELPDFITTANCGIYGLNRTLVNDYYLAASKATDQPIESKVASAVPINNKEKKPVINGLAYGQSDVDKPFPARPQNNSNTFAFIIANENYSYLSDVPFAHNDGTSFATYCRSVLGLPDNNINFYKDATWGTMKGAISYLKDIDEAFNGDINVIFYYAGHGAPSDDTQASFLIPVDAAKVDQGVCYPLDELYASLSDLKANSVKVFLDACFSGPSRDNNMIEKARKVAVVPKKTTLKGNLVVVSAASDDQTAWQYDSQGHGLFTYFLLKKLRETGGEVTMEELTDYISSNVLQTSVVVNRKRQTPSISASPSLGQRWRTWTVK